MSWGAGGGIGQAIARQPATENWQLLVAGRHLESLTGLTDCVYETELSDSFSVQSALIAISQKVSEVNL